MPNIKNILMYSFILSSLVLSSNVSSAQNKKVIDIDTVNIKPDRLDQIKRLADQKIINEDTTFIDPENEELLRILSDIKKENEISHGLPSNIEKMYRTINVSMSPDNQFETIYLSGNYTSTIIFVDKVGNPWTIDKFIVGNSGSYTPEQQSENIITFSPNNNVGDSNLTILFKKGKRPISFNLLISEDKVDYIAEIKINEIGNKSPKPEYKNMLPSGTNQNEDLSYLSKYEETFMSEMLSNTIPSNFSEKYAYNEFGELENSMRVFHKDYDKFLYIRTEHQIYSPDVLGIYISADKKTNVSKIALTSQIIVQKDGKLEQFKIK